MEVNESTGRLFKAVKIRCTANVRDAIESGAVARASSDRARGSTIQLENDYVTSIASTTRSSRAACMAAGASASFIQGTRCRTIASNK
jgi:hypothetical protein